MNTANRYRTGQIANAHGIPPMAASTLYRAATKHPSRLAALAGVAGLARDARAKVTAKAAANATALALSFSVSVWLGMAAVAGIAVITAPGIAQAQQLEPFVPPPNSLNMGRAIGPGGQDAKPNVNYPDEMRNLVVKLSRWAKSLRSDFAIVSMNGLELTEISAEASLFDRKAPSRPARDYMRALDGMMIEAPFFGFDEYNKATDAQESAYMIDYLTRNKATGLQYYIVDYTDNADQQRAARAKLKGLDALYYGAPPPDKQLSSLAHVPSNPIGVNPAVVDNIRQAKNFALLLDSSPFGTKDAYVDALANTNYDLLIIDPFHRGTIPLTYADIKRLRYKKLGTPRMLMAYLDVGTAETYRYYWKPEWLPGNPQFISEGNQSARWGQEQHVHYWDPNWQNILFGSEESYLAGIMKLGFDGVVLGGLNEFHWWQEQEQ